MKTYIIIFSIVIILLLSCNSNKQIVSNEKPYLENDTIRIANEEIAYEVIIIDIGFSSWFNSYARPKGYYSQSYLEGRNRFWVLEWNRRANLPSQYNPNLYEMSINYNSQTNYGYDVNYMIFNYLIYFQQTNKQQLGSFTPRL
jgi:hypothetical protein